jgi:hypothetical protein
MRVDLDDIGPVAGTVVRAAPGLLVLALEMNAAKRGRLARRIEILKALEAKQSELRPVLPACGSTDEDIRRLRQNLESAVAKLIFNSMRSPGPV